MAVAEAHTATSSVRARRGGPHLAAGHGRALHWAAAALLAAATLVAVFGPLLAPDNPLQPAGLPQQPPFHGGFLLGTDAIGRDVLSRVLAGWRSSWFAALAVIASGALIGGIVGVVAAMSGGLADNVLMRITDGFLALPAPVLAIAVVAALGPSFLHTLIAVAIVWWPFYARIMRGEIRAQMPRPHLAAARLAGAGRLRLALRHLLPGAVPAVVITASLDVGNLVLTLAALSFLGLGQPAPAPELGADTARNLPFLLQQWWIPVMPGLALALLALMANIAGDGVRDLMGDR
jgi:peptide/nickel transport system permease protein